jgi:serine/threonine protein phosphatase PrpC
LCSSISFSGDHFYKRNEAIPLKDQMISALPDVHVETLTENDHFMVLACDGIWLAPFLLYAGAVF